MCEIVSVNRPTFGLSALETSAHLWIVAAEAPPNAETATSFKQLLSNGENVRLNSFYFNQDKMRFLLSHAMVRTVLSKYVQIPSRDWQFTEDYSMKPEVIGPATAANGLRFNLTHTVGLVACIVTLDVDCGIDAEHRHKIHDLSALARFVLHPLEFRAFQALPEYERLDSFFTFWTAKEACMKSCGRGLSLAPKSFGLEIDNLGTRAQVIEAPDKLDWSIALMRPTRAHYLAVALGAAGPKRIEVNYLTADLEQELGTSRCSSMRDHRSPQFPIE